MVRGLKHYTPSCCVAAMRTAMAPAAPLRFESARPLRCLPVAVAFEGDVEVAGDRRGAAVTVRVIRHECTSHGTCSYARRSKPLSPRR
jgi:hypothetical protein